MQRFQSSVKDGSDLTEQCVDVLDAGVQPDKRESFCGPHDGKIGVFVPCSHEGFPVFRVAKPVKHVLIRSVGLVPARELLDLPGHRRPLSCATI